MKKYKSCTAEIGEYCSKHQCVHKFGTPHIQVSEYARDWIKWFKEAHKMDNIAEAVDKIIEIHKAWNDKIRIETKEGG